MNNILDKLGFYDLVAVLLTGMCISVISLYYFKYVFYFDFLSQNKIAINETLLFIIISYFIGLIFQELGSNIERKFFGKRKKLLKWFYYNNKILSDDEINKIFKIVAEKTKNQIDVLDICFVYNYCKIHNMKNQNIHKADKDHSLSAMSRSFSLYFFIMFISTFIFIFISKDIFVLIVSLLSAFLSVILWLRCLRFSKLKYEYILRSFYYDFYK